MSKKTIPLEPEAKIGFACIVLFFLVVFVCGLKSRHDNYKEDRANKMPDQVIRIKLNTKPKRDTVVCVPFKFYRVK